MPSSFNKLLVSMSRVFKAAESSGALRDLEDALDVPVHGDLFNDGSRGLTPRVTTGPAESASGSGAEKMVGNYSDLATQTGISAAYAKIAEELASTSKRVQSVEKSVVAIAGLLSAAMKGERFPEDETKEKGSESDEKDGESEDENTAKSIPTMGIPQLMRSLANTSRSSVPSTLATPPNMAVVRKAGVTLQSVLDQDDGREFPMSVRLELASIQNAMSNQDGGMMRGQHLTNLMQRASEPARAALVKCGMTI
jgi:hypothetical protein